MGVLETQALGSLSRHSPENGLLPRHTSVIRCKITDPETQCKFPKGEWTIRYSLLPRTNPKQVLGSETGLWCCKCMEAACNRSTYDVHSSCSSGITLPFSFHRITSRMQRCCPHTARMGEGNHKKKSSTFSPSTFWLCDSGESGCTSLSLLHSLGGCASRIRTLRCWHLFVNSKTWQKEFSKAVTKQVSNCTLWYLFPFLSVFPARQ